MNAKRIAVVFILVWLCLNVASVPQVRGSETTMRATDSFGDGDLQWTFSYEFRVGGVEGFSSPPGGCGSETSSRPGVCGFQRIFLSGAPHMTLSLTYQGKPYTYSADLAPGYMYSGGIPYSSYDVRLGVTLTAQIRPRGPCTSDKDEILLLSDMEPGSGDFHIIPDATAPMGSSVGVAIVVLVEYGGSIADQSFRRGVEASPPYEVDISVKQLEPSYDWVYPVAVVILVILVSIVILGLRFGRRGPKVKTSEAEQAARVSAPEQYCMFCGARMQGPSDFCPACGKSQI